MQLYETGLKATFIFMSEVREYLFIKRSRPIPRSRLQV